MRNNSTLKRLMVVSLILVIGLVMVTIVTATEQSDAALAAAFSKPQSNVAVTMGGVSYDGEGRVVGYEDVGVTGVTPTPTPTETVTPTATVTPTVTKAPEKKEATNLTQNATPVKGNITTSTNTTKSTNLTATNTTLKK